MPWAVLFAGVVPTLEMQRTAPIADLGHAVTQDGRDGPVSPDVAALAGIGTVVRSRLVPHPVKHGDPVPFRSASYAPGRRIRRTSATMATNGTTTTTRQRIANLPPAWNYRLAPKPVLRVSARWGLVSISKRLATHGPFSRMAAGACRAHPIAARGMPGGWQHRPQRWSAAR